MTISRTARGSRERRRRAIPRGVLGRRASRRRERAWSYLVLVLFRGFSTFSTFLTGVLLGIDLLYAVGGNESEEGGGG